MDQVQVSQQPVVYWPNLLSSTAVFRLRREFDSINRRRARTLRSPSSHFSYHYTQHSSYPSLNRLPQQLSAPIRHLLRQTGANWLWANTRFLVHWQTRLFHFEPTTWSRRDEDLVSALLPTSSARMITCYLPLQAHWFHWRRHTPKANKPHTQLRLGSVEFCDGWVHHTLQSPVPVAVIAVSFLVNEWSVRRDLWYNVDQQLVPDRRSLLQPGTWIHHCPNLQSLPGQQVTLAFHPSHDHPDVTLDQPRRWAYALCLSEDHLDDLAQVLVLVWQLRRHTNQAAVVCLTTPAVARACCVWLDAYFDQVVTTEPPVWLAPADYLCLFAWCLVDFDRVCWLSSQVMVHANLDWGFGGQCFWSPHCILLRPDMAEFHRLRSRCLDVWLDGQSVQFTALQALQPQGGQAGAMAETLTLLEHRPWTREADASSAAVCWWRWTWTMMSWDRPELGLQYWFPFPGHDQVLAELHSSPLQMEVRSCSSKHVSQCTFCASRDVIV